MSKNSYHYNFNGIRFSPLISQLEVRVTEKKIKLSPIHCQFLSALVENPRAVVTYDDLRQGIWLHEPAVDARLVRNIQSTKNHLVNDFKKIGVTADFIKPVPGVGYLLDAKVTEEVESAGLENTQFVSTADAPISNGETTDTRQSPPKKQENRVFGGHAVYIAVSSLFYGLLFWLALLLEVAYQFDRFGAEALRLGLPTVLWIAATSFFGLALTERLARRRNRAAVFVGLAFFLAGTTLLCLAISFFLPGETITVARIQTQPAFAAYLKNSLIYFTPLGVIFILIPFHFVCVRQNVISSSDVSESFFQSGAINLRPAHLFGLWLLTIVYSILSTFYLLDNLAVGQYHSLFVTLVFLRFFVYFSLGLTCLIWYNSHYSPNGGAREHLPLPYAPLRNVSFPFGKNYRLKLVFSLLGLVLAATAVLSAVRYVSDYDEEQIRKVVADSQEYESLVLYKNPGAFTEEQLDKFWTAEPDVTSNADRNRIRQAVKKLADEGRRYGDETRCEQFEFQSVEINADKNFAVVRTLEKWFIAAYFADGTLQKNKHVGPYFVSYLVRKVDGRWLIEKSNTARVNRPTPRLSDIETDSEIKPGRQFFARLTGQDFEAETVHIEIFGGGCPVNKPCKISNVALRENSKLTETALHDVPLTLDSGDFRVVVRNGDSPESNPVHLKVP